LIRYLISDYLRGVHANTLEESIEVRNLVSIAKVSEVLGVFKTVVSELSAGLLEGVDSISEARKILGEGDWGLEERRVCAVELGINLLEHFVEIADGVKFSLQFREASEITLSFVVSFQVSELDQSGVFLLSLGRSGAEEELVDPFTPGGGGGLLLVTLVAGENFILNGEVTILLRVGLSDSWENSIKLVIKSFSSEVLDVGVFHPRDRPGVTKAASDFFALNNIIRRAVESP